jgi:FKBP-type peptidyl-prolyl cis-trans isomerase
MKKQYFKAFTFAYTLLSFCFTINAQDSKQSYPDGIYVKFNTNKGVIVCQLEYEKTPMTVANFVGLTEGKFTALGNVYDKPFYNGLKFHRVIKDFMIQGGDPEGSGSGGPKHKFYDEIVPELKHYRAGILSMANSGPATNGSQFFITHKETPHLDGKHTVFGHIVVGQDVVNLIEQNDTMKTVTILRYGKAAKEWDATKVFADKYNKIKATEDAKNAEFEKIGLMTEDEYKKFMYSEILKKYPTAQQSNSGLVYLIENPGSVDKITAGNNVSLHYRGTFRADGKQFDASYDRGQPMDFIYKTNQMIPGFEEGIGMIGKGGKAKLVIPYYQAYGKQGRPGAIPPYSDLVFDIEVVNVSIAKDYKVEGLAFLAENKKNKDVMVTPSGLQYIVMKKGSGKNPNSTSKVTVHYHGTTPDGTVFDSSVDRGETISFGLNQVIKGWTEGLQLMETGAKYKFFIPEELAYGANPPQGGQGPIKSNMPLIFEVELFSFEDPNAVKPNTEKDKK